MNKKIFGIECLGCGTQRAFWMLMKGDFFGALKMYPAIFTLLLFFAFLTLHFFDKKRNYTKAISTLAIVNGIIMIVSYIYKMNF